MRSHYNSQLRRLEPLSHLKDREIARGEPDPRGWAVVNRDGRKVGEVRDLVVDTERMTAPYVDVELDRKAFDLRDEDPHVLVPLERAHREGRRLLVEEIDGHWVSELRFARDLHRREFWHRWWHRGEQAEPVHSDPGHDADLVERRPVAPKE